jgi:MFS family permease
MWKSRQSPRTLFVVISTAFGVTGHLVLAFGDDRPCFVIGVILVGISFGMIWPLMVLIVGDLYGKRCHGANYLFYDGFASAVGTLLISKYITQYVYESNIEAEGEITCYGKSCFAESHAAAAVLCFVAFLSAVATMVLTRRSYRLASY